MGSTTVEDTANRRVIQSKGRGQRFEHEWFVQIQKAILEGYRFSDGELRADISMRNFRGTWGRAVLLKGETPVDTKAEPVAQAVEAPKEAVKAPAEGKKPTKKAGKGKK